MIHKLHLYIYHRLSKDNNLLFHWFIVHSILNFPNMHFPGAPAPAPAPPPTPACPPQPRTSPWTPWPSRRRTRPAGGTRSATRPRWNSTWAVRVGAASERRTAIPTGSTTTRPHASANVTIRYGYFCMDTWTFLWRKKNFIFLSFKEALLLEFRLKFV